MPVLASHPVYQYFQRCYGLNIESLHWEPEEMPSGKMWNELAIILKKHAAKYMIWEGRPSAEIKKKLAEYGVGSLVFSPCSVKPLDGDYLSVMRNNIKELRKAYK